MLKKFRNESENRIRQQIRAVVERHDAELHEKVRIADIIDIDALNRRNLGTYALQAHFDFVLIDERYEAVAAIEFDGPGHNPENDGNKDSICMQANLPLIRIYGFEQVREINKFTLVRYLTELIFHARAFERMKENGEIDWDEPFMLSGFIKADAKHIFDSEFDFVGNANGKLTRALQMAGLTFDSLPHLSINRLSLRGPDGIIRAFISINSSKGPIVGMASIRFKLASSGFLGKIGTISSEVSEFVMGMAADKLLENIRLIADGFGHVVANTDEVIAEIRTLGPMGYFLVTGGGGSGADADLIGAFAEGRAGKLF
jgi:Protein of unknown function (DUF2726)